MFGMALTRPRHWQMAWTSSRMCAADFDQQYSATWQETFQFLSNVSRFLDCFFLNYHNFIRLTFASSAATYWRYGRNYYMGFVGNLLGFPAVKEFGKSVKNWQSYCHEFVVQFFWPTMYTVSPQKWDSHNLEYLVQLYVYCNEIYHAMSLLLNALPPHLSYVFKFLHYLTLHNK